MQIDDLIETFEFLTDWEERYRVLIDLGRKLEPLPDATKTEENRVHGCTSQVWMVSELEAGDPPRLHFRADSDSFIVKGLMAVLLLTYSGKTPQEIVDTDIEEIFKHLGLEQNLSPNRRNGFYASVERIKNLARQHLAA